jgi:DNA-binding LytR/AlgR family response regulator
VVIIIVIITLCAIATIIIVTEFHTLKKQVQELLQSSSFIEEETRSEENAEIEFESENKSEYFQLFLHQIMLIKSSSNYVEVVYKQGNKISKRLIRNTLKTTEEQFSKYPSLIRCHRSFIVNKNYIQKVAKGTDGLRLTLFDYPQEIHVSRQYVLKVKEALKSN